jgi:hypothetical protein
VTLAAAHVPELRLGGDGHRQRRRRHRAPYGVFDRPAHGLLERATPPVGLPGLRLAFAPDQADGQRDEQQAR